MSDNDSNCSQNEEISPEEQQGTVIELTPELEKQLYDEAVQYYKLKKKFKENNDDEDSNRKEVNILYNTVNRYIS
jgi:hypothetical protein